MRWLRNFQFAVEMKADSLRRKTLLVVPMLSPQEALDNAVGVGDAAAARRALRAGADPELHFALHEAAFSGHAACVEALLPHCDPMRFDGEGWSALRKAAVRNRAGNLECVKILASVSPLGPDPIHGQTPLMSAVIGGCVEAVEFLIPLCDPLHADPDGRTALMLAAQKFETGPLLALLPHSDQAAIDIHGCSALAAAMSGGYRECAKILADASELSTQDDNAASVRSSLANRWWFTRGRGNHEPTAQSPPPVKIPRR